ncbi:MAG: hypothetical protein U0Z26_18955 [Anaerolineales bacterium]
MPELKTAERETLQLPVVFLIHHTKFERWEDCIERYRKFIEKRTASKNILLLVTRLEQFSHRATLPKLTHPPKACFFLALSNLVTSARKTFAHRRLIKLFMSEMGKVLTDEQRMKSLPVPDVPTKIYAGARISTRTVFLFGEEPNDGLLTVKETLPNIPMQTVPSLHTFIMNSKLVTQDIVRIAKIKLTQNKDLRVS